MYIALGFWKKKLRNLLLKIFNKLENNNNYEFSENGEHFFVESLLKKMNQEKLNEKVIIFDVGANIGNYTLMLQSMTSSKRINVEFHLFEPTKECFKLLVEKFGYDKSVFLNNFGASSKNYEASIFYDKKGSGLASLYKRNLDAYNLNFSYIFLNKEIHI